MRKPFFKNTEVQYQFDRKGFVKLNLLDSEDLHNLQTLYNNQTIDYHEGKDFFVSIDNAPPEKARQITDGIEKILIPKLNNVLFDYQTFAGSLIVKNHGENNAVPPHLDWTFVDESVSFSASIWIPLTDVSAENGAIGVIPGSQTLLCYPRASPSPEYKAGLTNHAHALYPFMEIIEMRAGELLIFNNRLIHASTPNRSHETRVAVGIGIAPKEAKLIHYYLTPNSDKKLIEVYQVDSDFYNRFSNLDFLKLFREGKSPTDLKRIATIENDETYNIGEMELIDKVMQLPDISADAGLIEKFSKKTARTETTEQQQPVEISSKNRTFFQKYSLGNVSREVIWRIKGKKM